MRGTRLAGAAAAAAALLTGGALQVVSSLPATAQSPDKSPDTSLAACPPRQPVLRVAGVMTEEFSPHPVETRFASTHYSRLYLTPLFGADPWEEGVDARFGAAESWKLLPEAKGIEIKLRKGLTYNNGEPITAYAPASTGAEDYRALAGELLGEPGEPTTEGGEGYEQVVHG